MRIPDWLIYTAVLGGLLMLSLSRRENADAPPAPPAPDEIEGALLGPITPFDPAVTVNAPDIPFQPASGTAFSISRNGRWVTARHVVEGCRRPAILVGGGRAVAADVRLAPRADIAVLITQGGSDALPVASVQGLRAGQRAFHPGYPQGEPGEATSIFLGRDLWRGPARGSRPQTVLAWAESGRTDGVGGSLSGLSGAPVLDGSGQVVGVTLGESPRRGRLYAAPPEAIRAALARAKVQLTGMAQGQSVNVDNYGRIADGLRRDLRVARVACLT